MIICKTCGIPMTKVLSFSQDRHEKFCKCSKCYSETKHSRINDSDIDFKEVLHIKMAEGVYKNGD